MSLGISEIISIITAFVTIGVVYGTIKTNDKNQSNSMIRLETMLEKSDVERKDQIKHLEARMTQKFDQYNGLKERMAVGEASTKALFKKVDELCRRNEQ